MEPEEFVKKLRKSILEENINIYKLLFENTEIDQASNSSWQEALIFFKNLNDIDKKIFFKIIRQVSVDTISNVFSLLDGVSYLDKQGGDFFLTLADSKEKLNGDLQDIFLEIEEDYHDS